MRPETASPVHGVDSVRTCSDAHVLRRPDPATWQ